MKGKKNDQFILKNKKYPMKLNATARQKLLTEVEITEASASNHDGVTENGLYTSALNN